MIYSDPQLPSLLGEVRDEVFAVIHLNRSAKYYLAGEFELGRHHLHQMVDFYNKTIELKTDWLIDWMVHLAFETQNGKPYQFIDWIFDNLPAQTTTLQPLRRRAHGRYHTAAAFAAYQKQQKKEVRRHILPALWGDPAIIRNRGFLSISLRGLIA